MLPPASAYGLQLTDLGTMSADRCQPVPLYCTGRCGVEPPFWMGARLPGRVIRFDVDHPGPLWTRSLVKIVVLVGQAYPVSE
jgi:hypothetical protein